MSKDFPRSVLAGIILAVLIASCGTDDRPAEPSTAVASTAVPSTSTSTSAPTTTTGAATEQTYPDVIAAEIRSSAQGTFRFDVTVSSPYDTPERYADAWRVMGADGTAYGIRELLHDHAGEQPFTRSLDGVSIPDGVSVVTIEARDKVNGWGGATVDVAVPRGGGE